MVFLVEPVKRQFLARPAFLYGDGLDTLCNQRECLGQIEFPGGIVPFKNHNGHLGARCKANTATVVLHFHRAEFQARKFIDHATLRKQQVDHLVVRTGKQVFPFIKAIKENGVGLVKLARIEIFLGISPGMLFQRINPVFRSIRQQGKQGVCLDIHANGVLEFYEHLFQQSLLVLLAFLVFRILDQRRLLGLGRRRRTAGRTRTRNHNRKNRHGKGIKNCIF